MKEFVFDGLSTRVLFGAGARSRLDGELAKMGLGRVLAICGERQEAQASEVLEPIGSRLVRLFTGAVVHTPVEVTERVLALAQQLDVDGLVAIGGGSATGLAKAIALRTGLPQVILPTTYAGSEVTPILGQTARGVKTTLRDPRVRPQVVIYDVDLTMSLPPTMAGASGLNAIAHAVEALYAQDASPIFDLLALEGIRALAEALPTIARLPDDAEARGAALYGAWLCGTCLGSVGMSLHHKICHALGGLFDLPHAETHAIILPHALAYNYPAIGPVIGRLEQALGATDAPRKLFGLARQIGVPRALRDLGMPEAIEMAADLVCSSPYWNPRPVERKMIGVLLQRAWAGDEPTSFPA
jgi:alcohol dehydrogenase class IV